MFATLVGGYPPAATPGDMDAAIREAIAEQEAAGLEPVTDGHLRWSDRVAAIAAGLDGFDVGGGGIRAAREPSWRAPITLDGWRFAASCTPRAVKQAIVGPYTLAKLVDPGDVGRERLTMALAEALRQEVFALASAGCPLVQVDEDAATRIGDDPPERRLFRDAQRRLTDGIEATHLSLAISGGNADRVGPTTLFDAPYRSYLFDLIAGPDNWRLITRSPGDRGIICGALDPRKPAAGQIELLVWAAHYAASSGRRGLDRVGLAPAAGLERVPREHARELIGLLGDAARVAVAPRDELARWLDPRALAHRRRRRRA